MSGAVIKWRAATQQMPTDLPERLASIAALFQAIDSGDMLAALPECEIARRQHQAALRLLTMAERELLALCDAFPTRT